MKRSIACRPCSSYSALSASWARARFLLRFSAARRSACCQWWKARWAESPAGKPSFSEHRDPFEFPDAPNERLANVELTIAVIPYTEFQFFYKWRFALDVSARRRRKALKGLNWKADEHD